MRSCCRSVCFVLLMDSKIPHVLAVRGDPLDGWCTVGPPVYQFGWYPNRLGITGIGGEPKAVRKLKSGDFLIETFTSTQTKSFLLAKTLLDIPISVISHKILNSVRGVIFETELLTASDTDILEGFASQGVIHAHRIHIKKGTESYPTQHIILTFNKTELPKSVIAGYLHCRIRPHVPNPTICYKCQRFGHSKVACRGKQVCSRCASKGHSFTDCHAEPKCANCTQPHESNSKQCPTWHQEKQIQKLKVTKNISYVEARKLCQPTTIPFFATIVKESKSEQKNSHKPMHPLLVFSVVCLKRLFQLLLMITSVESHNLLKKEIQLNIRYRSI
ncbi:hypothetical protein AVEN_203586-1 [Araneus ventricosus]|uniref:CCHC-type domain-containing protein n=1 Tax=Araneus ventricosus TaxID=182803 RepID=A0A4Y2EP45_ARAVE|nr:hypothetical protein AVEN_203586-1 [Araneus ventricosus]